MRIMESLKKTGCLALCFLLMLGIAPSVLADEETEAQTEVAETKNVLDDTAVSAAASAPIDQPVAEPAAAQSVTAESTESAASSANEGGDSVSSSSGTVQQEEEPEAVQQVEMPAQAALSTVESESAVSLDGENTNNDSGSDPNSVSETEEEGEPSEEEQETDETEEENQDEQEDQENQEELENENTIIQSVAITVNGPAVGDVITEESMATGQVTGILPEEAALKESDLEGVYYSDEDCQTRLSAELSEDQVFYGCFCISLPEDSAYSLDEERTVVTVDGALLIKATESEPAAAADAEEEPVETEEAVGKTLWILVRYTMDSEDDDSEETGEAVDETAESGENTEESEENSETAADAESEEAAEEGASSSGSKKSSGGHSSSKSSGKGRSSSSGSGSGSGSHSTSRSGTRSGSGSGSRSGRSGGHTSSSEEESAAAEGDAGETAAENGTASVIGLGSVIAGARSFCPTRLSIETDSLPDGWQRPVHRATVLAQEKCRPLYSAV